MLFILVALASSAIPHVPRCAGHLYGHDNHLDHLLFPVQKQSSMADLHDQLVIHYTDDSSAQRLRDRTLAHEGFKRGTIEER